LRALAGVVGFWGSLGVFLDVGEGSASFRRPFEGCEMRDLIKMTCGNCGRANYTTSKNKKTMTEKLEIKKYCSACRKHFPHKEGKISKG
jgi:large subunit ribosomal protein L33